MKKQNFIKVNILVAVLKQKKASWESTVTGRFYNLFLLKTANICAFK